MTRPYTDGPVEIHPETPKPDYRRVAMERRRTLTLRPEDADNRLPEFLRPGWVPQHIWEKLVYTRTEDRVEAIRMDTGEVFGYITHEEAQDEGRNLGNLMAVRIQRHYLIKVKPELLIC